MTCSRAEELFSACWEDELSVVERDALELHLASCAACAPSYEQLVRVMEAVQSLPRAELRPGLADRVLARARAAEGGAGRVSRPRFAISRPWTEGWSWRPALAAAAAFTVVTASVLVWTRLNGPAPSVRTGEPSPPSVSRATPEAGSPISSAAPTLDSRLARAGVPRSALRKSADRRAQSMAVAQGAEATGDASPAAGLPASAGLPSYKESLAPDAVNDAALGTRGLALGVSSALPAPDSLFDHAYDVEFALDPVNLRRVPGTQSLSPARPMPTSQVGRRASITF